ncbi:amino acid permease [Bartonella apis]|uniref:amino acid permease n=1 Tax=Bartonella apis TaxID=1686310 RepID=UPI002432FAC2|nr:amino acid permease [Bartonella apis]
MSEWLRRKPVVQQTSDSERKLIPTLSWHHLVALGVGGIVGTGIYTLIGIGADRAGPAVLLSFVIAGVICACAAFAYAELATLIPLAGGAYTYSYAALGELIAWIVGWSLILEYSLVVSTVAVGWSAYATGFLHGIGIHLPFWLTAGYNSVDPATQLHGLVNLPAVFIVFVIAGMLIIGTKASATLNLFLVLIKIAALVLFIIVTLPHFNIENLHPFMPNGFSKVMSPDGVERGVMAAAAIIFFAFYGFDTIATAAEETKQPRRDLSIGIVGSLIVCIIIYVLVGLGAVGALHYTAFSHSEEPLAHILRSLNSNSIAGIIGIAAVVALPTVLLAFFYGQTRIFFVMGRDGTLPGFLSRVSAKTGTPVTTTIFTAIIIAAIAGLFRLDEIAALANAGTLVAFTSVGICLVVLRKTAADIPRKFKTPFVWIVGPVSAIGCIYLFFSLPSKTQFYFLLWNLIGIVFYFCYGYRKSNIARHISVTDPS